MKEGGVIVERAYWTAMLPNKEKNRFYNPIKQNQTHIKWLAHYLNEDIPLFSVVVFSERCELKKVTVDSPEISVIKRDRLYATVRNIWDRSDDKLDEAQIIKIYEALEVLTHVSHDTKAAHVAAINEKYKKEDKPMPAVTIQQEELSCPRCGGQLVLRVAKKGANAGKSFYGCSNYPKCRYIRD